MGVTCENHFGQSEGIGYYKVLNRGNKNIEFTFVFQLQMEIKPIKPNTVNWKLLLKVGEDAVIGFFMGRSYGYSVAESFRYI